MITKIVLDNFKRFQSQSFDVDDDVVLAGPNNSGKTTLLQAVAVWNLALQRWMAGHAESSKARQRTGVPISRGDFTAIPLREMDLLWFARAFLELAGENPDREKVKRDYWRKALSIYDHIPMSADARAEASAEQFSKILA